MSDEPVPASLTPLRKRRVAWNPSPSDTVPQRGDLPRLLDVPGVAHVSFSSDAQDHPIDHLFDRSTGPFGSRLQASQPDAPQRIELAFDVPQRVNRIELEAVETDAERTQLVYLKVSRDGGKTFQELRRHEYNFSPNGATFQHEDWEVNLVDLTHLRLDVIPNQRGHGTASLVSLRLYR